jgi:lipooligosaccharide transport system ATP-binding protein
VSDTIIEARQLVKRYGAKSAVSGIDLAVYQGQCIGIVGRNGAGKSTTMRMLTTVSRPTSGSLTIFGLDPARRSRDIKRALGVVPQANSLDDDLTAVQNLEIFSRYFGVGRAQSRAAARAALELARLSDRAGDDVSTLSGGMKRRLAIARATVNDPDLLLMDEPTAALDAQSRHLIWATMGELCARGKTIVLMSHDMEEVQTLSDYVYIMEAGLFVAQGRPSELIASHCRSARLDVVIDEPAAVDWGSVLGDDTVQVRATARGVAIEVDNGQRSLERLRASTAAFLSATLRPTTLEDVYLSITGRAAD